MKRLLLLALTAATLLPIGQASAQECYRDMYGNWACPHRARPPENLFEPNSSYRRRYRGEERQEQEREYRCRYEDRRYCR